MTDRDPYRPIDPQDAPATASGARPATACGTPPTPTDASVPAAPATPRAAHATSFAPDASDAPTVAWEPPRPTTGDGRVAPTHAERVRPPTGGSRVRWAAALLVTALVVAVGTATVMLLTGQTAASSVVGYAAPGSVAYGELRLDLPGDQRQELGEFLAKFPGFQDQSTLDVKLDDILDRVVKGMTEDRQDWSTKIKPWFGGELGVSLGGLPDPDAPEDARVLLAASVADVAKARAWLDELTADVPKTTADHNGTRIVLYGDGTTEQGASAFHENRTLLAGDEASVRAALDTGGRSNFANDEPFRTALASLSGNGLGYFYFDLAAYAAWAEDAMESLPGASAIPMSGLSAELLPEWLIVRAQARGDSVAFETVLPHKEAISAVGENRRGFLADHVPPTTFVLLDGHEAGRTVLKSIELAKQDPAGADAIAELEEAANVLGGFDGIFGWMGDGGLALARDGSSVTGGLVFQATDRPKADRLFGTVRSFVQLAGGSLGITLREEDHNGTPITIVDFGDLRDVGEVLGEAGGLPPGMTLPEGRLELAWTVTDELVVISVGPAFVRAALDAGPGPSLAEDARYRGLIDRLGAENTASVFVDMTAIRELLEGLATSDPAAFAEYEQNYKPYLLPLDALVQVTVRDGDLDRSTMLVTVK